MTNKQMDMAGISEERSKGRDKVMSIKVICKVTLFDWQTVTNVSQDGRALPVRAMQSKKTPFLD